MSESVRTIILQLSLIKGIGAGAIKKLSALCTQPEDWAYLYHARVRDFEQWGFSSALSRILVEGLQNRTALEHELLLLEKHAIEFITIFDDAYPPLLNTIDLPPPVLYWQGNYDALRNPSLGVVGSRLADAYGNRIIQHFIPLLVKHGLTIVSGGALGADTMAHRETLNVGGCTVAIIGSGLLRPYPSSNRTLFKAMIERGGAVVSPFPLLMEGLPANFPARNRIISGLAQGVLVVQAAAKSGASITAHFALEQGREVFAIPGQVDHPLSAGCHALIKEGASLVTCPEDIVQELRMLSPMVSSKTAKKVLVQQRTLFPLPVRDMQTAIIKHKELQEVIIESRESSLQERILEHCITPRSLDELGLLMACEVKEIASTVFDLQIEGKISQNFAGMWQKI